MVDTADSTSGGNCRPGPPDGERGVGAKVLARAARWGRIENYMAQVNDLLCLLVAGVSKTALDNLDEILHQGIDGVFIGPRIFCVVGLPG